MTDISILTVTYNASATLSSCLQSVSSQTKVPEHLIIDGCSTDHTLELAEKHAGHPLQIVSERDNGIYDAMNKGINNSTGEIVGILNADDFYASADILERVVDIFEDKSVDACYGDLIYVNEKLERQKIANQGTETVRYWKSGKYYPQKFYWGWMPPHPTFFVRRTVYEKYGLFNLELGSAADYELMLRFLLKHRVKAAYIPKVLVKMRTGGVSNASLKNRLAANSMDRKAWTVNGLKPYPWTLWMKPIRKIGQWFAKK